MDKNAIKRYAMWARRELISCVSRKALQYGISENAMESVDEGSIDGVVLTAQEMKQRKALVAQISRRGYEQVMEEVACTWFIFFMALRFMEVNQYLPSKVRVFTNEENAFCPQILDEAVHVELQDLNREKVCVLKETDQREELYKYLLIMQCKDLNGVLPEMFRKLEDYSELLFPDNLLREGSVIEQMIKTIPQEDWKENVQIIGWLYQYYNTEKKDEVFAALKKNIKISKDNIPAATQIFTPDWIVRYMVENSLGRLWVEGHPDEDMKKNWEYYLEEAEQEPAVQAQLGEIRREYADLKPEDIKCIDPCMGSGHVLAYMFDVLVQIYEAFGVLRKDAVVSIVENNLYGLDIDDRAAQLAYFTVMMKARQYDQGFLKRGIQPKVYAIQESNGIDCCVMDYFCNGNDSLKKAVSTMKSEMHDAKEYGSILKISNQNWKEIYARFDEISMENSLFRERVMHQLLPVVRCAEVLARKYEVVVTNPPYMGASGMNAKLSEFIRNEYADYKSDFFSAFVVRCSEMAKANGKLGFLTPYVWMFIQSYEKMREFLYDRTVETLIQFEYSAFEDATVPICTFAFSNYKVNKKGAYIRLTEFSSGMEVQRQKTLEAVKNHDCGYYYEQSTNIFNRIPGNPVAYWATNRLVEIFSSNQTLGDLLVSRNGMKTGKNERFVFMWYEVSADKCKFDAHSVQEAVASGAKFFPYNKGGEFRKWYGNNDWIVDWENKGERIFGNAKQEGRNVQNYPDEMKFSPSVTWSLITSGGSSFRYKDNAISDIAGMSLYEGGSKVKYYLALCNTKICENILQMIAPTMNAQAGDIARIPVVFSEQDDRIMEISEENVALAKEDWDAFETSWDFKKHPLL